MLGDQYPLRRQLNRIKKIKDPAQKNSRMTELSQRIQDSCARRAKREQLRPTITFDQALPIVTRGDEILAALQAHQVIVVCGETGSGKTTQLPKLCLQAGRGIAGMIGHTQPRRIAARAMADRIAEELATQVGAYVGYKVRFNDQVSESCYIKLMTDGILLTEIQQDRFLNQYDTLIIDEAHERSLNIDLLLGYIKNILPKRPDLKVIITSATIDPERFAAFFEAPIISVSGRVYPVEVRYQPPEELDENADENAFEKAVLDAIAELTREPEGDILAFFYGENAIRQCHKFVQKRHGHRYEVLPLYSRQTTQEQNRIFHPGQRPRIILATNVAETSLTVPGIRYVIDTGDARISRYSYRSKVQRLPVEKISQASANQRAGRCGRQQDGICIRLYSEEDFLNRPVFTEPEILRANLAGVILRMHTLGMGDMDAFPFVEAPDSRFIRDGIRVLQELQALDSHGEITPLGRQLSRLPVDPRIGRILLAAGQYHCVREMLAIAALLSIQDPRESAVEIRDKARLQHQTFSDDKSDFVAILNLWHWHQEQRKSLSNRAWRRACGEIFVSALRMQEWADVRHQLAQMLREQEFRINQVAASYEELHKALLTGFVSHIAEFTEDHAYRGARNRTLYLHPSSVLSGKTPKWIFSAQVTETSRTWAVYSAQIEPAWAAEVGQHVARSSYYDPYWDAKQGQVFGLENVVMYGLTVIAGRRIYYGKIDPQLCRELFIREGLVMGNLSAPFAFVQYNAKEMKAATIVEDKLRRLGIVDAEEKLREFYQRHIPEHIISLSELKAWLQTEPGAEHRLQASAADFLAQLQSQPDHPDHLTIGRHDYALSYRFEPGAEDDGVSLHIPLMLLNQLHTDYCDWLVPGLLEEKIIQLIKSLPKPLRRNFVPAPDFARAAIQRLEYRKGNLYLSVATALKGMTGIQLQLTDWGLTDLPTHLHMNYKLENNEGKLIAQGRDLKYLQQQYHAQAAQSFNQRFDWSIESQGHRTWDFDTLPVQLHQQVQGIDCVGYPALVDHGDSVAVKVFDNKAAAQRAMVSGLTRLFMLDLGEQEKYLHKNLPQIGKICLLCGALMPCAEVREAIIDVTFRSTFLGADGDIRTREQYRVRRDSQRAALFNNGSELCLLIHDILNSRKELLALLDQQRNPVYLATVKDIKQQLQELFAGNFIADIAYRNLQQMPRYLKAARIRLDKLPGRVDKDTKLQAEYTAVAASYSVLSAHPEVNARHAEDIEQFRWMLQELRVALFAQEVRTPTPISTARIEKFIIATGLKQYL